MEYQYEQLLRVKRKAPGELSAIYSELWQKLSTQRFAWLQWPWLILLSVLFGFSSIPLSLLFAVLWIWQRIKPVLLVCRLVELCILVYFILLVYLLKPMISFYPSGAFVFLGLTGMLIMLYDASARTWHHLFVQMYQDSTEFAEQATEREWVVQGELPVLAEKKSPFLAVFAVAAGIIVMIFFVALF